MTYTGKHKIQNIWEEDGYVVVSQPNSDIPLYIVQPIWGGKQKTLHRDLLLSLGYKVDESLESDEEIEIVSPLFEFSRISERVSEPNKLDQVDKSTDQVLNPLIDLHDSAVAPISKDSSNDHEQNGNNLLESFDSEHEIVAPPVSVQNKMEIQICQNNWISLR